VRLLVDEHKDERHNKDGRQHAGHDVYHGEHCCRDDGPQGHTPQATGARIEVATEEHLFRHRRHHTPEYERQHQSPKPLTKDGKIVGLARPAELLADYLPHPVDQQDGYQPAGRPGDPVERRKGAQPEALPAATMLPGPPDVGGHKEQRL